MGTIRNIKELNEAILLLEGKQAEEAILLKEQFIITYESLKPINFLRSTIKSLLATPDFKEDFFNTSLSLVAGYFSKKLAIGSTHNPFKLILGSILQLGVTSAVSNNADDIRVKFMDILNVFFKKKKKKPKVDDED